MRSGTSSGVTRNSAAARLSVSSSRRNRAKLPSPVSASMRRRLAPIDPSDTTAALPGLTRHVARITEGTISEGQEATATIDSERRDAIRRNHTATHLLHWALREVLGTHVKQAGSLVAPDRLRFDFSHYGPLAPDELARVEALANERVLANEPVRAYETTKEEAERIGAIAF